MNRINKTLRTLKTKKKKAFIAYITAGDPDLAITEKLVYALEESGCDLIELGVPFSDPIADGPTIQQASQRSLKKKTNLLAIIRLVRKIRRKSQIPIIFMSYYNPIFHLGVSRFAKLAAGAGVDGLIIPDLPVDESKEVERGLKGSGIEVIYLLAPTSTNNRVKAVGRKTKSFIYYVSVTGITGARKKLPEQVRADVRRIKRITKKPTCVGFGVSNPRLARQMAGISDGVIVGSAIVKIIGRNKNSKKKIINKVSRFTSQIAGAVHSV